MRSGNYRRYLFLAMLAFFFVIPIVKSTLQEFSLGQDLRRIRLEYSMYGPQIFHERLEEIVTRAPLDPADVDIQMQENLPEAKVLIEIRYRSRMKILFYPFERQVVIREEIPLVPL